MKQSAYSEKFKDPRWQQKRLEVFQRDEFKCRHCGSSERQLHAHHLYYVSGRDPWAYPLGSIWTLCDECHEYETKGDGESWTPNDAREWEVIFNTGIPGSKYELDFACVFESWRLKSGLTTNEMVYELMLTMNFNIAHDQDQKPKGEVV